MAAVSQGTDEKGEGDVKRIGITLFALMIAVTFSGCSGGYQATDFTGLWGNNPENINRSSGMAQNENYLYLSTQEGIVEIDRLTGEAMTLPGITASFDYINILDQYLFYNTGIGDTHESCGFSAVSLDGRFFKELSSNVLYPALVYNNWVYGLTTKGGELRRVELKTGKTEVLAQQPVEEFFVTEDALFYTDGQNLYQAKLDGSIPKIILEDVTLYSLTWDEENRKLFFVDTSQTEKGIGVLELDTLSYLRMDTMPAMWIHHWKDDLLLVQGESQDLFFLNLNTEEQEKVTPFAENFSVFNDTIYFEDKTGNLIAYFQERKESEEIYVKNSKS